MASPSVHQLPANSPITSNMPRKKSTVTYGTNPAKRLAESISAGSSSSAGILMTPIESDPRAMFLDVHNSDGTEIWQNGVNGPTADMLDTAPDENGNQCYMRRVDHFEKKSFDWLKHLAEGVIGVSSDDARKNELRDGTKFFFSGFPAGYRLYEQVRVPGPGSVAKARRDTYLYGHPKGPRKRFRSPADFLAHMKWLSSDPTKDPVNCKCHACKGGPAPPAAVALSPTAVTQAARIPTAPINTAVTTPLTIPMTQQHAPITHRPVPILNSPNVPGPIGTFPSALTTSTQPAVLGNILTASVTHREREQDLQFPGLAIYRLGEQVWFQTGPHWAIGVVVDVPTTVTANYKIHPLNSPLISENTQPHRDIPALQLRPWVAWSTPPVTNRGLDLGLHVQFDNLPWEQESLSGSIEVDASILKSRDVDISYTLIEKLTSHAHYAGIYHGAERFWIGDAVRIKPASHANLSTGREILVVSSIQDLAPGSSIGIRSRDTGVSIVGDVFRLTNHTQSVPAPGGLPTSVQADLAARVRFTASNPTSPYWTYTLVVTNLAVKLEDIKGRWYPGSSLFRIVHGTEKFAKLAQTAGISHQEWDDTGSKMNEMGTGGGGATSGWKRYEHRHHAFNKALPSHIVFTPLFENSGGTIQADMRNIGLHQTTEPSTSTITAHTAHTVSDPIDLTVDDNEGMEFLADHDSVDEEFMKRMGEDAASFLADDGDFYGGL